jgi:ADP-ribose pyrophosphatase YjhB (NUDIX family)
VTTPNWLQWAQRLQALAQTGLAFCENPFDIQRYEQIRDLAAEMMAAAQNGSDAGDNFKGIRALFDQQAGYATPKVDVRGVVFRDDSLLMVREKLDNGRWTLPGGWADVGEPPSLATEREVWEEAGYHTRAAKLLALYDRNKQGHTPYIFHAYKAFFLCSLLDDQQNLVANVETEEAGWFREDELAGLDLSLGRVLPAQLERFFEHHRHPDWPTDFD